MAKPTPITVPVRLVRELELDDDPLGPARGFLIGVVLGVAVWAVAITAAVALIRKAS